MKSKSKNQKFLDLFFMFIGASVTVFLIWLIFDLEDSTAYILFLALAGTLAGCGLRAAVRRFSAK